ncbi:trafficking protein Mon1-domain-containing protein [Tuber brumale]|nr:trafficking protein Mon1-domain-containing protein [Tuber brumale]
MSTTSPPPSPPCSHPSPSTSTSSSNEDQLPTPRASTRPTTITLTEDYFAPPLPPRVSLEVTTSNTLLSIQSTTSSGASTPGLQAKPTTAISLPEGVHAQQQDAVVSGNGSITGAPSFSDSVSVKSLVPTLSAGDNDVESMLGEILEEEGEEGGFLKARRDIVNIGGGGVGIEEVEFEDEGWDESSDEEGLGEEELVAKWRAKRKHFFILSSAGKPIYSRHGDESVLSGYMGVIQAIISFFQDDNDTLKSFSAGRHRFAIAASGPLYLVAISSMGESDSQLRAQLDALYTQVLSTLTLSQLNKIFAQRGNFDLRRLLGGTEVFLDGLSDAMTLGSPQVLLSALECVKMRKSHREKINSILLKHRSPNLLYGLVIADGRMVSVLRPKRHSLHPPDLQLLFSMLFNATTFRDGGEHWTPICLPKFNSKGFLHAYIHFFRKEVAVVLISADKDAFFEMRVMKEVVVEQLGKAGSIKIIEEAVSNGRYTTTDVLSSETAIRHFLYRSKNNVQFTMPSFEPHFYSVIARRRLMNLYQRLHATVHAKNALLKVHHCIRNSSVSLSWVTPTFELYCVAVAGANRAALAKSATAIAAWVKREEERLFIGGVMF